MGLPAGLAVTEAMRTRIHGMRAPSGGAVSLSRVTAGTEAEVAAATVAFPTLDGQQARKDAVQDRLGRTIGRLESSIDSTSGRILPAAAAATQVEAGRAPRGVPPPLR